MVMTTEAVTQDAIRFLRDRGCHFTRCDDPEHPRRPSYPREFNPGDPQRRGMGRAWQRTTVPLDILMDSWDHIGFLPRSLGVVIIDVDQGDPFLIELFHEPLFSHRTARGWHLYYHVSDFRGFGPHDREGYTGRAFFGRRGSSEEYGCIADVLFNQHCYWHPGEVLKLAAAVRAYEAGKRRPAPPPAFLFERPALAIGARTDRDSTIEAALEGKGADREGLQPGVGYGQHFESCHEHGPTCRDLADVEVGCRECALFDAVRSWAYRQDCGDDWRAWLQQVGQYAVACERRLRHRVGQGAAIKTAVSVARYCWEHRTKAIKAKPWLRDTSSDTQRTRGRKGGQVTAARRRAEAAPRRRAMYDLRAAGRTAREVARRVGVSIRSVWRGVRIVTDSLSPGGGDAPQVPPKIPLIGVDLTSWSSSS